MTSYSFARRALAALLAVGLVVSPSWAQTTLNLKDAEIGTLIATVSEVTGKNFIVDPRVKGKVTVVSATPMDAAGVYETFLAVLQVQGFAAIPSGDTIKIVPETNAKSEGGGYNSSGAGLPIDEIATHVYQIQNVSAAQLVPILRPLIPQWGHLAAYAPSNMLIISDRAANVQRLEKLIRQIDTTSDREIDMVQLKFAGAAEVVRTLTSLTQGDKNQDPSVKPAVILADERSNSVLVGGDKSDRQKLLDIIKRLDIEIGSDGATQVVYLRYASAENLAPILEGYAQQVNQADSKAASGAAPAAAPAPSGGGNNASGLRVLADKDTNALIITAPPKAMRAVRDVIAQLDIRRAQVLVDGIIAEVSADKSSQLGIDWAVYNNDRIAAAGILSSSTLGALGNIGQADSTAQAIAGAVSQGINIGAGKLSSGGTSFALLLKALKGDGNTNVLSQPSLLTLDNEEAEFSVGQEVPFLTGSFSNTGTSSSSGSVNPFQTIERKDVGLTLGITPQINEGNAIKLKIKLEVSSLASTATSAVDLVTNKRTLNNTVTVEDGQILVLGGLIDDTLNDSRSGVPFISDIPLIGALFKYRSINRTKRNLMVFIRPAILRKQVEGDYYTRRKYDQVRDAQLTGTPGAIPLIGGTRPILPRFDVYKLDHMPADLVPPGAAPSAVPADAATSPSSVPGSGGFSAPPEPVPVAPIPSQAPRP